MILVGTAVGILVLGTLWFLLNKDFSFLSGLRRRQRHGLVIALMIVPAMIVAGWQNRFVRCSCNPRPRDL